MQKFLIRIIFSILFGLTLFFFFSAYQYYRAIHSDDPVIPIVFLEKGMATVIHGELAVDMSPGDTYNLNEKDIIVTKENTLAIITWPDRSETRLGANSRLKIDRMTVASDYSSIQIEFALEQGKVWSTVVRTMYPGSYFRTRIPGQGVIAGVRGTVYDIDTTRGYIRSIEHSVTLIDGFGRVSSLLPGEIVSLRDILRRLSQEVVDTTWTQINTAKDTLFLDARRKSLQEQIDILSGKTGGVWDSCVRWILAFFPTFDDLSTLEYLLSDIPGSEHIMISKTQILSVYQKIQDTKFVQERERIRSYIEQQSGLLDFSGGYMQTFARGALWDSITFSGMTLVGAESIVADYTKNLDSQIQSIMRDVSFGELDNRAKETMKLLLK